MRGVSSFLRMTPEITCRQGASNLIVLDGAFSGSDHRCARCSMQQLLSELRNSNLRHHFSALRRSLSSLMMTTRFRRALGCGVWLIGVLDRGNNFAIRGFETERKLPGTIQTGKAHVAIVGSYVVGLGRSGPARAIFDTSGDFDNDQRSDLRLWINGEPWGPPHAPHELILERGTRALGSVQNLSQCAGRPATSSRCKSDTMKE